MYCYNCDTFFSDSDAVKKRDGETALHILCCPHCGVDDIGESSVCKACGKEFTEDEIADGYCLKCLWNAIDYDTALEWMKNGADCLAEFMLNDVYDASMNGYSSRNLDAFLEESFRRLVADEKLRCAMSSSIEPEFLIKCRYFCLTRYSVDFGHDGREFAEWFAVRKKEKRHEQMEKQ